jgi:tRNA uridine 5-carboxymethylaminomethyl modification enzyme
MPPDVQQRMVRSLPGFGAAEILRPGYAIEYDSFDPLQLHRDLSVDGLDGVWFAGQINGTTGYEEAAGQGLMAGINAVRWLRDQDPIILGRDQAYIGVMIDDLVTKGTDEPYRMLTARAEHRLGLACDLADGRLWTVTQEVSALAPEELARVEAKVARRDRMKALCDEAWVTQTSPFGPIAAGVGIRLESGLRLSDLFRRQQIGPSEADACLALLEGWAPEASGWDLPTERDLLLFDLRYAPYRDREAKLLAGQRGWDHVRIPSDLRVEHLQGISREVLEKLTLHRPETLGQASRIPGITPAALTLLHLWIHRSRSI